MITDIATPSSCAEIDASPLSPSLISRDFSKHPCFNKDSHHTHGRIHLPVAPRCNVQCNFCNRKFDCMNESRPGVTSAVLTPIQAADYLDATLLKVPNLAVMGIAGPGDPFANAVETMATLKLVRQRHKDMILCLATNGLGIGPHIDNLAALEVSHVTITVNAVDPIIGAKIYAWVRDGRRPLRGIDGAQLLLDRQMEAITKLKAAGIVVKINSIIIPGINDRHIEEIAKKVGSMGVDLMNCMAFLPVEGAEFENLPPPDPAFVAGTRMKNEKYLPQMTHCARCRADAVGLINEPNTKEQMETLAAFAKPSAASIATRPYIAVASEEGMLVNQHLGEANRLLIFKQDPESPAGVKFVELRKTPEAGSGLNRWNELGDLLHDCRALLVSAAGPQPRRAVEERGIRIVEMEGLIEEGLVAIFKDQPIPTSLARRFTSCGDGCKGAGNGCS